LKIDIFKNLYLNIDELIIIFLIHFRGETNMPYRRKSQSSQSFNLNKREKSIKNRRNDAKSHNEVFKDKEVKQTINQLLSKHHLTEKELLEKIKQYYTTEEKEGFLIPYEKSKDLFTEEAGGFCKSKDTGKIRYNSNYWKAMFESPDRPKCDYEKEDMLIAFHTHPYGFPRFSAPDLQVAIQYPDVWYCVGAGTSYNKRMLCIKPKMGKTHNNLMKELYGTQWEEYFGKFGNKKPSSPESTYEKVLPESFFEDAHHIFIEKKEEERFVLPENLERKVYYSQLEWLRKSGLFDIKEFECKNNDLIERVSPSEELEIDRKEVGKLEAMMGFYHENYDIFIDPTPLDKMDWDIEGEEEKYRKTDIAGMVTFCDFEIEDVKDKSGNIMLGILHTYLTITDETGDADLEMSDIVGNWMDVSPYTVDLNKLIMDKQLIGKYISVKDAIKEKGEYLKVKPELLRIEPIEKLEKYRSWV
jgi:proteasome lid subunit RPN8/RPN11